MARGDTSAERVAVLIPAFEAAAFLDRTLRFARGQTHTNLEILVSVDLSTDATAEVARAHAAADQRVEVVVHAERQGWAANVNLLLDRATAPYAFLYFHDDVIVPQYVEALVAALAARPDATSVYCTMGHFGGRDDVSPSRPYDGSALERLLQFFLAPERGSPLRAVMRTAATGAVRMPEHGVAGMWANEPFLTSLVAAGPTLAHPDTLYYRWDAREGGLTHGWKGLAGDQVLAAWRANLATMVDIVTGAVGDAERETALTGLLLRYLPPLLAAEERLGEPLFDRPGDLHPTFADVALPPSLAAHGDEIEGWAEFRWTSILRRKPGLLDPTG